MSGLHRLLLLAPLLATAGVASAVDPGAPELRVTVLDCGGGEPDVDVSLVDNAFDPSSVVIPPHSVVRFTNEGAVVHTVTSGNPEDADAGERFDSGDLAPGDSYCLGFDGTGAIEYFCRPHSTEMQGEVKVAEPTPE